MRIVKNKSNKYKRAESLHILNNLLEVVCKKPSTDDELGKFIQKQFENEQNPFIQSIIDSLEAIRSSLEESLSTK